MRFNEIESVLNEGKFKKAAIGALAGLSLAGNVAAKPMTYNKAEKYLEKYRPRMEKTIEKNTEKSAKNVLYSAWLDYKNGGKREAFVSYLSAAMSLEGKYIQEALNSKELQKKIGKEGIAEIKKIIENEI